LPLGRGKWKRGEKVRNEEGREGGGKGRQKAKRVVHHCIYVT